MTTIPTYYGDDPDPTFKASLEYTGTFDYEKLIHHTVCEPTSNTRGFTQECWEDLDNGKFYSDATCAQELTAEILANTVVYAKLPSNPITVYGAFDMVESDNTDTWGVKLNWAAETTFGNANTGWSSTPRYVEFAITGDNVDNARLVWTKNQGTVEQGRYSVKIYVNNEEIFTKTQGESETFEGVTVQPLSGLKKGDVVKFEVSQIAIASNRYANPTFKASLEYTGTFDNENIIHHTKCEPTANTRGFIYQCWEDTKTGNIYSDADCTDQLVDHELAYAVRYAQLPQSPIYSMDEYFHESEHEKDWSVNLYWAAVTSFPQEYWGPVLGPPHSVIFKVTDENISNARLVWNRNEGAAGNGLFDVSVYINDELKYYKSQGENQNIEGVFVTSLHGLKKGDEVKFEVKKTKLAAYIATNPTFKASLEYTIDCQHEYLVGSAICSKCGEVKYHEHTYVDGECTQCGAIEPGATIGYVGTDADRKNVKWELNEATHVLTFSGTGAMEAFDLEHNAWRNEHKTTVTKVVIGEGITTIGDGAYPNGYFIEMSGLTEVSLPSTLKTIGSSGFQDCVNLASISLPEGLETIKANGIRNCKKLTTITLPSTLIKIMNDAFADCSGLTDIYIAGNKEITTSTDAFRYITYSDLSNITLHVNGELYDWAKATAPWKYFNIQRPYNLEYIDAEGNSHTVKLDTEASDNTFTLTDGWKDLIIYNDIPVQTLTYTRNFSAAGTWQPLYVPFEMQYSDWADKFDIAAINNFHEYTNADGETTKIELEVRYIKGKLYPNIPYLIRAKSAGVHSIVLNNAVLKVTSQKKISCRSTEYEYGFTGTYESIDGLKTKDYIFLSGGRLCKANNDTDILKSMRWYLNIQKYFSVADMSSPAALSKPIDIILVGDTYDDLTGLEDVIVTTTPADEQATDIHTLDGIKLNKPQPGINIINGKAVYVK